MWKNPKFPFSDTGKAHVTYPPKIKKKEFLTPTYFWQNLFVPQVIYLINLNINDILYPAISVNDSICIIESNVS